MTKINGINYNLPCCIKNENITPKSSVCEDLKHKVEHLWNKFCILIKIQINPSVQSQIQNAIDNIDKIEATESKPRFISELRQAFASSMKAIKEANLNPERLPKQVALQLSAILARFGIAIYANKDVQHPFQSSLDVLKTAVLMQQYALGITKKCPDLTDVLILDDLYSDEKICEVLRPLADSAIANLNPETWAARTLMLTEKQQLLIPEILRYIDGALGYIKLSDLNISQHLLETAEAVLISAQKKSVFNQTEVDNYLAELKYNNITGFLAAKIADAELHDRSSEIEETKKLLKITWDECIALSKDPEKMRARCNNKRIFIEKMSLENQLNSCRNALNGHLSLPKEKQDIVLIALAHHNVSHLYAESGNFKQALEHAASALIAVIDAKSRGENNVQFDSIIAHANELREAISKSLKDLS